MSAGFSFRPIPVKSEAGHYRAPPKAIAEVKAHPRDRINGATLYLQEGAGEPSIDLPRDAEFSILPSTDEAARDVVMIAGASGGGKSWIARGFAEKYMEMWPKRKVYVVSALKKDETLDALPGLRRLNIQSFVDDPIEPGDELRDFKKTLVIFDDCEALQGAEKAAVNTILKSLLMLGRHSSSSVIVCNHQPARGKETGLLLSESTLYVVFPQAMGYQSLEYLCKAHIGMSPKEIHALRDIPSRWVALSKSYPRYMIASTGARLL